MRVANVEGLVTLFYDGSKELYNRELNREWSGVYFNNRREIDNWESWNLSDECKRYWRERLSWQQIIVEEGVTEIPAGTFQYCCNVKRVIFANTVIRIERFAFYNCESLVYVKFPINLEYIAEYVFYKCNLYSIFIPPSCREIRNEAFRCNENLSIMNVPQDTQLNYYIVLSTALAKASPFEVDRNGWYYYEVNDNMNTWIKNMNDSEEFSLHRACSSFQPLKQVVYNSIQEKGLKAFREKNSVGITPSQYLKENPYTELTEKEIIHDYLMKLMGEGE